MKFNYISKSNFYLQYWLSANYFKSYSKAILTAILFVFAGFSGFGQETCSQTFSVSGSDGDPTVLSISSADISCNSGGAITNITLNTTTGFSDGDCNNWYEFTLEIDSGTPVTGCRSDFDNTDLTGFSNLTITSADTDSWPTDSVTIEVELTVTYTPPSCLTPQNLVISNITGTTADLDWDAEVTATGG